MLRSLVLIAALLVGCHPGSGASPEMRVIGVHDNAPHDVVFVQVTNPASQTMKLTRLEYSFQADGATVSTGEVPLERDVPAGAAVVVEIPLDSDSTKPLTLLGQMTAIVDEVVRTFPVEAQIAPH